MAFVRTAISTTGNTTAGSPNLTNVANTTGIYAGMLIYGANIPADTLVNSVSGTTVVMNRNAVATQTGVTITGQYITQTGTDADPSGLSAMTGVTTITSGTGSRLKSIFDLGTNQLRIQGTLTHDPDQYTFVSGLQLAVRLESGAYNYGIATTVNGKTSYSKSCGLELTYQGGIASNFPIQMTGGTFNWRGGIIRLGGAFSITNGTFDQKGDTSVAYNNNTGTQIQLRTILPPANMRYEKIKLAGVNQVFFWTTQTYAAISAALENGGIQTPSGFSATQTYADFVFANNQAPGDFYINQLSGTSSTLSVVKNPDVIPRVLQLNTAAYGVVETRTSLDFNMSDSNGVSAANVVGYVKDSNNGARTNENQLTSYTSDQTYIASSSVAGALSLGDILVDVQMRNPAATNTVKHDYRSNYGNGSADFNVFLGGYEYLATATRQTLIGNGGRSVAWTMFDDTNVTLTRANALTKLASSFTVNAATKTVTVTASSTYDDLYDALKAWKYNGTQANVETPTVDSLVVAASGQSLTAATGWALVIGGAATLAEGNKFKKINFQNITINGALTGLYQIGANSSARLTLEGSTDTSIRVSTNTGAEYDFASDIDATYVEYFAPGKTGTWTWIAERLGKQRQSGTFTPGVGGDFAESLIWLDDLDLTETSAAVLAAITDFGNPNEVLNYAAYWRTTQPGIGINKITKDGNSLSWGDANVNWVASAATPLAYDSATNTFTAVTTSHAPGSTIFSHRTTGLMTFGAGTNFQASFKDSDGLRVSISGLDPQGFGITWHMRYKKSTVSTWTTISGTGNSKTVLMEEALYDVQVRAPGYDWKLTSVDAAKTLTLDLALNHHISSANTPQYTMAYSASLEAIFSYDATALSVAVGNTTGAILNPGFAELYQATQRIQHLPALVWSWVAPVTANASTQKIIIPSGNPITMFLTSASTASVKMTCPVIHDTGVSADDRVKGNASGFSIILGSPATAESAGLAAQIIGSLGGPSFVSEDHGLSVIKSVQDLVKTAVDAIQDKTDNLPADPAAAGDAMTLTLDYEAAKHAASQASVDQLAFDALTIEQVEDSTVLAKEASIRKLSIKVGNLE